MSADIAFGEVATGSRSPFTFRGSTDAIVTPPSSVLRFECPESDTVVSSGLRGPSGKWLANLERLSEGKRVRRIGLLVYVVW